jgi:hypothetical protein
MNTKIVAILMASIVAMAVGMPMAMCEDASTSASVNNIAPDVEITSINPDPASPGETVTVNGTLSDDNGIDDVSTMTYSVTDQSSTEIATGSISPVASWGFSFDLDVTPTAGTYTVSVTATDSGSLSDTATDTFEVSTTISISVTAMDYGIVNPGSNANSYHTVTNTGNVGVVFADENGNGYDVETGDGITWLNMTGPETIADSAITTTWNATTQIATGNSDNVNFTLNVPAATLSGSYTGQTTFTPSAV